MPEYRRFYQEGGGYFFTVVTHQRQGFLLDEPIRKALRESIQETRKSSPFKLDTTPQR